MTYFRPGTYALVPNKHLLPQMKGAPLSVYITLCAHADAEGVCFPGIATIAETSGYSRRVVIDALKTLIELKVIERHWRQKKNGDNDSNLYRILIVDNVKGSAAHSTPPTKQHYPSAAHSTPPSAAHSTLTNPIKLTQLTKGNFSKSSGSKLKTPNAPASPTIDPNHQQPNVDGPGYKSAAETARRLRGRKITLASASALDQTGVIVDEKVGELSTA